MNSTLLTERDYLARVDLSRFLSVLPEPTDLTATSLPGSDAPNAPSAGTGRRPTTSTHDLQRDAPVAGRARPRAAHRRREGSLRVPPEHVTADGYRLGQWIRGRRKQYTPECPGRRSACGRVEVSPGLSVTRRVLSSAR
jgi:hypothetical protein